MSEPTKEQIFNELYDLYLDEMVGLSMHVCDSNFRSGGVEEKRKQVARHMVESFHLRLVESSGEQPAPKVEPEVDNSGHPQAEERRETARAVKEAFASQREWADKWRGQDNPALEPKSDSYYETVRDRAVALILSPPAKEGVSVSREWFQELATSIMYHHGTNDAAGIHWPEAKAMLRSLGIRVEGEPEGGGG